MSTRRARPHSSTCSTRSARSTTRWTRITPHRPRIAAPTHGCGSRPASIQRGGHDCTRTNLTHRLRGGGPVGPPRRRGPRTVNRCERSGRHANGRCRGPGAGSAAAAAAASRRRATRAHQDRGTVDPLRRRHDRRDRHGGIQRRPDRADSRAGLRAGPGAAAERRLRRPRPRDALRAEQPRSGGGDCRASRQPEGSRSRREDLRHDQGPLRARRGVAHRDAAVGERRRQGARQGGADGRSAARPRLRRKRPREQRRAALARADSRAAQRHRHRTDDHQRPVRRHREHAADDGRRLVECLGAGRRLRARPPQHRRRPEGRRHHGRLSRRSLQRRSRAGRHGRRRADADGENPLCHRQPGAAAQAGDVHDGDAADSRGQLRADSASQGGVRRRRPQFHVRPDRGRRVRAPRSPGRCRRPQTRPRDSRHRGRGSDRQRGRAAVARARDRRFKRMIRRIISVALHQPAFVLMLVAVFVGVGIAAFESLPVEAFPDVTDVQVTVISLFPGHAPEEVEKQVTIPLEIQLSGLPNAVRMFSHTQFGLSYIILTFDDNATDYFARQQVLERLQGADLPPGVQPELAPLSTAIGEIYRYRLRGDGMTATDLRSLQDWVVSRRLKMIPGVADVVSFGGFIKQYEVTVNTTRMKAYNVTLQQVFTALGRGNANAGGSFLEQGEQQYLIRGIGMLRSADDIGDIVVTQHNGTPLLIKDIADVVTSAVPRQGLVGQDDEDEIVSGIVLMRKGENPSAVLTAVKSAVDAINTSALPKPARIVAFYDRTQLIDTTLHTVFRNLLEGAVLVTIVLFLFLGNIRAAGIVAFLIPLCLRATFIGLRIRGIPANLLSLGAMDFGIIVDGAVIVLENVFRHRHEHREQGRAPRAVVLDAAAEVGRPTVFSILIIILAHLPIFTLQRHEGRIFAPMAYTVVAALVGSLLFSLTLVPLLCLFLLGKSGVSEDNALVRACKRIYQPVLARALEHRILVLAGAVAALLASLAIAPRLGTEFLPELNEGSIWINIMLPPGMSVTETSHQLTRIRSVLRRFPEVKSVMSKAGRPEDGTDPKMVHMAA